MKRMSAALFPALLLLYTLFSCVPQAPHNNPVDPAAAGNQQANRFLEGGIYSYYEPRVPIAGATVTLSPGGRFQITDEKGRYRFDNIEAGSYVLYSRKTDYHSDSLKVIVSDRDAQLGNNLYMNALPRVTGIRYYSEHIDQLFPGEIYQAFFSTTIGDADGSGDVKSVAFDIPELGFRKQLSPTSRPDSFAIRISAAELPQNNLFDLAEYAGRVLIEEVPGTVIEYGGYTLNRIIERLPVTLLPAWQDTVSRNVQFSWQPLELPYEFSFEIEIYQIVAGVPVRFDGITGISSASANLEYPKTLPEGQYAWTIGIRDNLHNLSRSRESYFISRY